MLHTAIAACTAGAQLTTASPCCGILHVRAPNLSYYQRTPWHGAHQCFDTVFVNVSPRCSSTILRVCWVRFQCVCCVRFARQ